MVVDDKDEGQGEEAMQEEKYNGEEDGFVLRSIKNSPPRFIKKKIASPSTWTCLLFQPVAEGPTCRHREGALCYTYVFWCACLPRTMYSSNFLSLEFCCKSCRFFFCQSCHETRQESLGWL